jgi:hypothetical protein
LARQSGLQQNADAINTLFSRIYQTKKSIADIGHLMRPDQGA